MRSDAGSQYPSTALLGLIDSIIILGLLSYFPCINGIFTNSRI